MTTVHVVLTELGMQHLVHNDGISELEDPEIICIEPSGALRFEWTYDEDGKIEPKETLVYAHGMWACYTVNY